MQEIKYKVEIKGNSPLLMNRYVEGTIEETKIRKGEIRKQAVEDKLYLDSKGDPYVPSTYLKGSLVEAGKNVKVPNKLRATYSKVVGSTVQIFPDTIALVPNKWKPYTITGVNPMTRGRMSITRPRFEEWGLKFDIIATDDIAEEKMITILEEAGRFVGIGDWRPQKKGMFGKFIVVSFKKVNE